MHGTVDNTDADFKDLAAEFLNGHRNRGFDDRIGMTANDLDVRILKFFAREHEVGRTQSGFHHTTRSTEDRAGTGVDFHRGTFTRLGHFKRVDTLTTEDFSNFASRHDSINVLERRRVGRNLAGFNQVLPSRVHFRTSGFENLGGTRRYSHDIDVTRVFVPDVFSSPSLGDRATHLNWALGR